MSSARAEVRAAHARWGLQFAILQEEEGRILEAMEECSRTGMTLPELSRLKMARTQCNEAFQALMASLEEFAES